MLMKLTPGVNFINPFAKSSNVIGHGVSPPKLGPTYQYTQLEIMPSCDFIFCPLHSPSEGHFKSTATKAARKLLMKLTTLGLCSRLGQNYTLFCKNLLVNFWIKFGTRGKNSLLCFNALQFYKKICLNLFQNRIQYVEAA